MVESRAKVLVGQTLVSSVAVVLAGVVPDVDKGAVRNLSRD